MATADSVREELAHSKEVAQSRPPQSKADNVISMINRSLPEIAKALPQHVKPERIARIATTAVRVTPKLADCTQTSFLGALLTAAQLGLEPNTPTGEAYLLPFGRNVQLIIGYRGYIKLANQSGQVRNIMAMTVYENDHFDYKYGSNPFLEHTPILGQDPGPVKCWYACATFTNGGTNFVVLDKFKVEAYRARARSKDDGPWVTDYDAMARKTCIRRLAPYLPMSVELAQAMQVDEEISTFTPGVSDPEVLATLAGVDTGSGEAA
ncbi:recombinase RecT [Kribbella sp. NPDC056861]|uniref:recombinase RecT n=1 Tax=Kribbella sp. NPDC056861 TaxID=3154857 RepID=UPI00342F588E